MHVSGDVIGVFLMWLLFMGILGAYVVRIAGLLREQTLAERALRFRYAAAKGATVREAQAIARTEANQ